MISGFQGNTRLMFMAAITVLVIRTASAQYDEPREYAPSEARFLTGGAMYRDVARRPGNPVGDSLAIQYGVWMPVLSYHQGTVDVMFGYTRYALRGASRTAIFFGTTISTELMISGRRTSTLLFPLCIAADFTKSESDGAERDHFNIASVGIGGGLKYRALSPALDFSIQALGVIQYSFEGLSTGHGSSSSLLGEAQLLMKGVRVLDGIVLGYRFRYQSWSMSAPQFNYRAVTHGPYLGVMF